jgi:hypothetical protein
MPELWKASIAKQHVPPPGDGACSSGTSEMNAVWRSSHLVLSKEHGSRILAQTLLRQVRRPAGLAWSRVRLYGISERPPHFRRLEHRSAAGAGRRQLLARNSIRRLFPADLCLCENGVLVDRDRPAAGRTRKRRGRQARCAALSAGHRRQPRSRDGRRIERSQSVRQHWPTCIASIDRRHAFRLPARRISSRG